MVASPVLRRGVYVGDVGFGLVDPTRGDDWITLANVQRWWEVPPHATTLRFFASMYAIPESAVFDVVDRSPRYDVLLWGFATATILRPEDTRYGTTRATVGCNLRRWLNVAKRGGHRYLTVRYGTRRADEWRERT